MMDLNTINEVDNVSLVDACENAAPVATAMVVAPTGMIEDIRPILSLKAAAALKQRRFSMPAKKLTKRQRKNIISAKLR
jgi:hypothetical protein